MAWVHWGLEAIGAWAVAGITVVWVWALVMGAIRRKVEQEEKALERHIIHAATHDPDKHKPPVSGMPLDLHLHG